MDGQTPRGETAIQATGQRDRQCPHCQEGRRPERPKRQRLNRRAGGPRRWRGGARSARMVSWVHSRLANKPPDDGDRSGREMRDHPNADIGPIGVKALTDF